MNKFQKVVVALLGAIAIAGTVTAVEIVRMARMARMGLTLS